MKLFVFVIVWVAGVMLVKVAGLDTLDFHWLMALGGLLELLCLRLSGIWE